MKTVLKILLICLPVIFLAACHSESKSNGAHTYFSKVIAQTDRVVAVFNDFIQRSTYNEIDSMKTSNVLLEKTAKLSIDSISGLEDHKGSSKLKEEAIAYIKSMQDINNNEFKEFIRLYSIPEDQFTDAENVKIDSVSNSLDAKMTALSNRYLKAQTAFAKENDIKLDFNYELDSTIKKGVDTSVIVN